jgi:chromosome segregation ATPase
MKYRIEWLMNAGFLASWRDDASGMPVLQIDYGQWRDMSWDVQGQLLRHEEAHANYEVLLKGTNASAEDLGGVPTETAEEFVNNLEGQVADLNEKLRQRTMQVEAQATTIGKMAEDFLAQTRKLQELDRLSGILRAEREELRDEVHTLKDNMGKIGSCMRNISSSIDDVQGEIDAVERIAE